MPLIPVRIIPEKSLRPSISHAHSLLRSVYNSSKHTQERLSSKLRKKPQNPSSKPWSAVDNHGLQDYFVPAELLRALSRLGFQTDTSVLASLWYQQRKALRLQKYNSSTALRMATSDKGMKRSFLPAIEP